MTEMTKIRSKNVKSDKSEQFKNAKNTKSHNSNSENANSQNLDCNFNYVIQVKEKKKKFVLCLVVITLENRPFCEQISEPQTLLQTQPQWNVLS